MSFDLYGAEATARVNSLPTVKDTPPGAFDNFLRGTGMLTMQGFAKAGRAVDLLGSLGPTFGDKMQAFATGKTAEGVTERQDRYFGEHDEVYGRAVDYWTPKPGEVGVAGEVVGQLASTLTTFLASPGFTIGSAILSQDEDLVKKGVPADKAQLVGLVQGASLGLGAWMPILGTTGFQRMLLGGSAFNVAQGIVTRGSSGTILEGTAAADDFKAFDWQAITLDALLGLAFGGLAHLSPAQRSQGAAAWKRIHEAVSQAKPSDIDALATLRQAQHLNVDSAPGRPEGAPDLDKHVLAMRQAIDDLVNGRPVNVEEIVAGSKFLPDEARAKFQRDMGDELAGQVRALLDEGMARETARADAEAPPGFLRTAEQLLALKDATDAAKVHPDIARAIEIAKKPGFERTATEKIFLDSMLNGRAGDYLVGAPDPAPLAAPRGAESLTAEAAGIDPLQAEATRFAQANPDLPLTVGRNPDGSPITATARQFLEDADNMVRQANDDARLFEVAASCMLGVH